MRTIRSIGVRLGLLGAVAWVASGCGSDDGGNAGGNTGMGPQGTARQGAFLDSAVEGLEYSTGTKTGTTDSQGRFE